MDEKLNNPTHLKPNDKVAFVAPAFAFNKDKFHAGRDSLETHYKLKTAHLPSVYERAGYFAGTDERRLNEFYHWLTDDQTQAVFAIRGGYGCQRIYPALIKKLRAHKNLKPKIVLGYSDLTIILNGLFQDLGWITFHGPVAISRPMTTPKDIEKQTFNECIFSNKIMTPIEHPQTITFNEGQTKARIVGGCLSLINASLSTPYEIRLDNHILFIEDVGERPYRIDRMLTQLIDAGKLNHVKGIIIGEMHDCQPDPTPESGYPTPDTETIMRQILTPLARKKNIPVIYNFPAGHGSHQITFPIGCMAKLTAALDHSRLEFTEAACV